MLELEVLVRKLGTVDALSASTVTPGEVATLNHKILDHTVEGRALVSIALLSSSQSAEVLGSLGDSAAVKTHCDAADLFVAMLDVKEDFVGNLGRLR